MSIANIIHINPSFALDLGLIVAPKCFPFARGPNSVQAQHILLYLVVLHPRHRHISSLAGPPRIHTEAEYFSSVVQITGFASTSSRV